MTDPNPWGCPDIAAGIPCSHQDTPDEMYALVDLYRQKIADGTSPKS